MIRLEYYLQYTPEPANYAEAIANVRSLISNTNVPFGAPVSRLIMQYLLTRPSQKKYSLLLYHPFVSQYGDGIYPTWWASFVDT